MASNSYSLVAADVEPDGDTQRPLKRSTHSAVEEYELALRDQQDPLAYDGGHSPRRKPSGTVKGRPARSSLSRSAILQAVADFALVLPALYFLAFGFVVYSRDGTPLDGSSYNASLVSAAALGPTIFPIAFAAVVGRFLKSAAAWRLERKGATVAALEQLLGSKTVLSAVTLPFSLRVFNALTVPLFLLWALSPIGGQSSRRVISTGPVTSVSFTNVSYLDTNSNLMMGGLYGGSSNGTYWPTFSGAYVASLLGPLNVKEGPQDGFAHFKIPMIEYLDTVGQGSEFQNITDYGDVAWSSLIGIPMIALNGSSANSSLPYGANSTFTVESSYWNLACDDLALRPYNDGDAPSYNDYSKPPYENVRAEKDSRGIRLGLQKHTRNSTGPRIIYWESSDGGGISHTKCELTTSYVESRVLCSGRSCAVTGIRRSLNPYTSSHLSMLDFMPVHTEDWQFFVNWLWATPHPASADWSNPNDIYFTYPDTPLMPSPLLSSSPDIATTISTQTFNQRFSQLLNTAWLASVAPGGITGRYVAQQRAGPAGRTVGIADSSGTDAFYFSRYATADVSREHVVVHCHGGWLAVLVISSLAMLLAGAAGLVLEVGRRGPDMLASFSSLIRDNRWCGRQGSSSMLDGVELSREIGATRVRLGDVNGEGEVGHVAIGLARGERGVRHLRSGRLYD